MPSASYPYAVGRVRVLEQSLLGDDKLKRLSDAPRGEFARLLGDWGFAAECPIRNDVDALVEWREHDVREIVADVTPDPALTDLFFMDIDAANIKLLIKSREMGDQELPDLQKGVWDIELLKAAVKARDYSPLGQPIGGLLDKADCHPFVPQLLSARVDSAIYTQIFSILKTSKDRFCTAYFKLKADCSNMTSVLRAKALGYSREQLMPLLVPGGSIPAETLAEALTAESGGFHGIGLPDKFVSAAEAPNAGERIDLLLTEFGQQNAYDSFGIGPVVNYAVTALGECRAIRVAFARAGKEHKI